MGYIEGLLGGFTARKREVEQRRQVEEDTAARQEEKILHDMSNSPDPEIRAHGIAGLLDTASPRKRKSGFRGWLGETQGSPHMEWARNLANSEAGRMAGIGAGPDEEAAAAPPGAAPAAPAAAAPAVGAPPPQAEPTLTRDVEGQPTETSGGPGVLTGLARTAEGEPAPVPSGMNLQATGEPSQVAVAPDYGGVAGGAPGVGTAPPAAAAPTGAPAGAPPQAILGNAAAPPLVGQPSPVIASGQARKSRQFFQSPEGQIRLNEQAKTEAGIAGMRVELKAAGFSPDEIKEIIKQHLIRRYGVGSAGTVQGFLGEVYNPVTEQWVSGSATLDKQPGSPTFGKWLDANPESETYGLPVGFRRSTTVGSASMGQWTERAAGQLGYTSAADARAHGPEAMTKVNELAQKLQADAGGATAGARRTATGVAAFQAPIGVSEAQKTNVPVGSSSAQFSGQQIASEVEQARRRGVENISTQLDHISTLLGALPKQNELAGLAPNAVLSVRRRSPDYRAKLAQLESAIDNIQASLSRSVQENRGAQTEKDAERALSTITAMKGSLLDPLGGDTQESAAARIKETQGYLKTILSTIPGNPAANPVGAPPPGTVPGTPPVAAAPTAATPGASGSYKDAQGVWHITIRQ